MTDDIGQTPEEVAAAVAPGSAADLTMAWIEAVLDEDWARALDRSTESFRKDWTGVWVSWAASNGIFAVTDAAEIYKGLLELGVESDWFQSFAELSTFWMRRHLDQPHAQLAVGSAQRPLDAHRAQVLVADYNEISQPETDVHPGAVGKIVGPEPLAPLFTVVTFWDGTRWLLESWDSRLAAEQDAEDVAPPDGDAIG